MRTVTRFESNLLRILHCFLGHAPVSQVLPALVRPMHRPTCLGRDAVELVKHSLATGTVMLLARGGAWTSQRHLRGDQIREGSLWQRSKPEELGLEFSSASLDFLSWITAADATNRLAVWVPPRDGGVNQESPSQLTGGDQFLLHLAARALRDTSLIAHWYRSELFRTNALIALTLPEHFAEAMAIPHPNFDPWMTPPGAGVLETMQNELTQIWLKLEKDKSRISRGDRMLRLGQVQESVLNALFDSVERSGRRDLCRFLLETATRLLGPHSNRNQWIECLDTFHLRLAERTEVYRNASAFLRASTRFRKWHSASLGVGFFDEGYAESQLWKSLWESSSAGNAIDHADRIIQELSF
jgi:hypothetical protein